MSDLGDFISARLADDEALAKLEEMVERHRAATAGAWYNAPLPPRLHRCDPVQSGYIGSGAFIERCACGGIRMDGGPWMERNSRRGLVLYDRPVLPPVRVRPSGDLLITQSPARPR